MDRLTLLLEGHNAFARETFYNLMQADSVWKHTKSESPEKLMFVCVCIRVCYKTQSFQKLRDQPGDQCNNLDEIGPGSLDLGGQSGGDESR